MSLRNKSTESICCLLLWSTGPHPFAYLYSVSKLKTYYSFIGSLNLLSLSPFKNVFWPRYIKPQGSLEPVSALGNPRASLEIPGKIIFFLLPLNFPRTVVQINLRPPSRPSVLSARPVRSKVSRTSHLKRYLKTTYESKYQISDENNLRIGRVVKPEVVSCALLNGRLFILGFQP